MSGSKIWLPPVKGFNRSDSNNGYAGIMGRTVTGLRVSSGHLYRVHTCGGNWL